MIQVCYYFNYSLPYNMIHVVAKTELIFILF